MKKILCLSLILIFALTGCNTYYTGFTALENGNIVSPDGVEYSLLANEGILHYLGEREFLCGVKGEEIVPQVVEEELQHIYQSGIFSIKGSDSDNILIRKLPNNEWYSIYRKSDLPQFDFSIDNCIRLEMFSRDALPEERADHVTCGDGITDPAIIAEFLSDVRSQQTADEAGLDELIKLPDGRLENCYGYAVIYGFFEEEPNLVRKLLIMSYNDLAYSVYLDGEEYVLPEEWLQALLGD